MLFSLRKAVKCVPYEIEFTVSVFLSLKTEIPG